MLRDVIRDRDIEQENALTEFSRLQTLCCLKLYKRSVCSRMCKQHLSTENLFDLDHFVVEILKAISLTYLSWSFQ